MRCAVLRLHGRVTEEGHRVVRFDPLDRLSEGALDIAVGAADAGVVGAEPRLELRTDRAA